eukprot:s2968_g6.t1
MIPDHDVVLLEHPSPCIGSGSFTWTPAQLAWNSRMMTLSTLRFGSGWNKVRFSTCLLMCSCLLQKNFPLVMT